MMNYQVGNHKTCSVECITSV